MNNSVIKDLFNQEEIKLLKNDIIGKIIKDYF